MINSLKDMKFSKFNKKVKIDEDIYLYNGVTGGLCKVNEDAREVFLKSDLKNDINSIEALDQKEIASMVDGGMIVHEDLDEHNMLKSIHNMSIYGNENSLGLTLLPTMGCNFRCTYCFEQNHNYPTKMMSTEVMDKVVDLVDTSLRENGELLITWFGGEPLLDFSILEKLQLKINKVVQKKKLILNAGIVTNGYLMTKDVSNRLVDLGIKTAQITIDGTKEHHDSKRVLANGNGTFDKIIKNILEKNDDLYVSIRINIDKNNVKCIPSFIDYLKESGVSDKKNVSLYFSVIRDYDVLNNCLSKQCFNIKEYSNEELELNEIAYEKGINVELKIRPNLSVCGSLSPRSYVIEPDGTIQKCWSAVGDKSKMVGHLVDRDFDKIIAKSNQAKWYSWSEFDSGKCKECDILPLCMGGCPYYTIYDEYRKSEDDYNCNPMKYTINQSIKLIVKKIDEKSKKA
ncbi:MAG: SPASM domain-containing protein [Clostridium sp.]|uniref:SPASM domain-containing protein n=1 Tax=Clostridium chrysemydis TaxID=2665504 RepID=UPI003EE4E76B